VVAWRRGGHTWGNKEVIPAGGDGLLGATEASWSAVEEMGAVRGVGW